MNKLANALIIMLAMIALFCFGNGVYTVVKVLIDLYPQTDWVLKGSALIGLFLLSWAVCLWIWIAVGRDLWKK